MRLYLRLTACAALLLASTAGQAATVSLVHTLENPTPQTGDQYANDIAVEGDVAVVGAWLDDTHGTDAGAVYVYNTRTGALIRELKNPNLSDGDEFGSSVAISGNRALVGARSEDIGAENAGVAYLFDLDTGDLLRTYNNPEPGVEDRFGRAVSLDGDRALIGAYFDTPGAAPEQFRSGSAYLFETDTGDLVEKMRDPTPRSSGFYANEVAVSGAFAVTGNYRDSDVANQAGSAEIFDADTGALAHFVANPSPDGIEFFGRAIAILGTQALISASWDNDPVENGGRVYVVDLETGAIVGEFLNPDPDENDNFGHAVALSEAYALIGARRDDTGAENTGSAYLFDRLTGELLHQFENPEPGIGDQFGVSLAMDGNTIVIGAEFDDGGAVDAGRAYVYQVAVVPLPAAWYGLAVGIGALGVCSRMGRRSRRVRAV